MGRKGIAMLAILLLAVSAFAWTSRRWQKFKHSGAKEAGVGYGMPGKPAESASSTSALKGSSKAGQPPGSGEVATPQAGAAKPVLNANSEIAGTKNAAEKSNWKSYSSSEYGFEIQYPADWLFNADYENNKGKPPSGHRAAAYAGETRNLFSLEIEGADQPREGGGDFEDGAVVTVKVTGTNGILESWGLKPGQPWYLITSTPEEWLKMQSSLFGGNHLEFITIGENGFTGRVEVAHDDEHPEKVWGETGGAYRILPSGRALLIDWERMNIANNLSYQNYFVPMLSSFKLLRENPAK